jgi:hypothetical protein
MMTAIRATVNDTQCDTMTTDHDTDLTTDTDDRYGDLTANTRYAMTAILIRRYDQTAIR